MVVTVEYGSVQFNIEELFERAYQKARQSGKTILVSHTARIGKTEPLAFFRRGRQIARHAFYWERPDLGFALAGVGSAHTFTGEGVDRFAQVSRTWQTLRANAVMENNTGVWGTGALLMGGFSFDPLRPKTATWEKYPDAMLVLPRVQLASVQDCAFLTINALISADTDVPMQIELFARFCRDLLSEQPVSPGNGVCLQTQDVLAPETWQAIVARTAAEIRDGKYQKVVLAREIVVQADQELVPTRALAKLRKSYPNATLFAVAKGDYCFVGATPERLVQLQGGTVRTVGLAGTMPRGATPEEDARIGEELMNSSKNRHEHAVVVDTIKSALGAVCDKVQAAEAPGLLKLANVQHLYTPITGQLQANHSILELVEQLHPTPAVGGLPNKSALEAIREREQLDRGWYAAPVGWLDAKGDGEFVVALRSALLRGNKAVLFVGCGIMGDSDPATEYQESCLKAKVMLSALS